jgi:hypothetical protein
MRVVLGTRMSRASTESTLRELEEVVERLLAKIGAA